MRNIFFVLITLLMIIGCSSSDNQSNKTEEITSSKNIIDIDKQFDNKQPSRIDIIEDPDGINTDEVLGYPTIKEDI